MCSNEGCGDRCLFFIDLIELDLIPLFFQLGVEIHTTVSVMNELYLEQQQILGAYQSVGKLTVHNLGELDFLEMQKISFPRGLSFQDSTVIYLAKKLEGAMVISSDKKVREFAGYQGLTYHGIFWVLDQLVNDSILSKAQALAILNIMPEINSMYQGMLMKKEIDKRMIMWGK